MSGRLMKTIVIGGRKVSIYVAEEVQEKGFKRVIDAIDPSVVNSTVEKTAAAFSGSIVASDAEKARIENLRITYGIPFALNLLLTQIRSMPHPSPEDPVDHATVYATDKYGKTVCVAHVTENPKLQTVSDP
ncbi:hypothetical protein V500_00009 [Pseudogymnoascus sp. VKM F-4518 (FW-2643)]|nr:hypothetical protein V500_00009 [Pseudogymnoascus sp. VKM F-4518 (FW-2643)]